MKTDKRQWENSIIVQVLSLFLVGILTTGAITYIAERHLSNDTVMRQTEMRADEIADEVIRAVKEYPAYSWLLRYWYLNSDNLDIEYDVGFQSGTRTEEKCAKLQERHPGLPLRYLGEEEILSLPEEDQRLYAEICYTWLVDRMNQIKRSYRIDYLFCVVSLEPFDSQVFLFSAADEGAVRGTSYTQVYPLGHAVMVGESQRAAMRSALDSNVLLALAGDYVDDYTYLCDLDGKHVFIGMTYEHSALLKDMETKAQTGTTYAMLNQTVLSVLCLVMIYVVVLRPLRGVQRNIRLYHQTKDSKTVVENLARIRPANEIGQLSEDVSDLALEMDDYLEKIRTITAETERIGTELALATRIQAAMLPHVFPPFPSRQEFDIYASMDPAKEVGGDFYDFFLTDQDHLCMVMADVSGKGVPAALFMMAAKIILQSCAMLGGSPAQILTKTNEAICSNNQEEMFVTVWLGILEISTGKLTAANAGHEYPLICRAGGAYEIFKDRHGLVIGAMENVKYREYELQLQPGDRLFVYTDGVPEANNDRNELFGMERMLKALNADAASAPEETLKSMRAAVDSFVQDAQQFDDLTMLCMEYRGQESKGNV